MDDVALLMTAWVHGWTRSRRTPEAVEVPTGLLVQTGTENESVRRVIPAPTPELLAHAVAASSKPRSVIKLPGDPKEWLPRFPAGWEPDAPAWLMTTAEAAGRPLPAPEGYRLDVHATDERIHVRVFSEDAPDDAADAAHGQAGIAGGWGVPDQIATSPEHQRRGLGQVVLSQLSAAMGERDAVRAVLVASQDGQQLYEALGWRTVCPVSAAYLT